MINDGIHEIDKAWAVKTSQGSAKKKEIYNCLKCFLIRMRGLLPT